ncbi:hypothetical protein BDV96DRAFT_262980 [Lophiotrema nucula]|uniref:Uncharacterized protein n=1 Tax=Lophiotrema nucula TaxID=690887 RepID=A0A6A5YNL6_9PLEO|nr:hypothetical protein BDV96DRAFT_262980 [Lophiotrema nucula]
MVQRLLSRFLLQWPCEAGLLVEYRLILRFSSSSRDLDLPSKTYLTFFDAGGLYAKRSTKYFRADSPVRLGVDSTLYT